MEKKDDRSKDKRRGMKIWKGKGGRKNTGVVDVADSSDDRFVSGGWISGGGMQPQPQPFMPDEDDLDEDIANETGNAQLRAGDFKTMSQLPSSIGGHFQFSSEKNWEAAESLDNTEAGEYFTLNLKLLNAGLKTIPFYKRMDYSTVMFTPTQLQSMNEAAEAAEQQYQTVLRDHEHRLNKQNSATSRKSHSSAKGKPQEPAKDELDDLLTAATAEVAEIALNAASGGENVPPTPVSDAVTSPKDNKKDDDIQQWLDNVLDE